jgi:hypothetical protein
MLNWTPSGFVGEMFRTIAKHVPPPPEARSPLLWGTEEYLSEILGAGVQLKIEPDALSMRFLSPEHYADFFIENYGPTFKAHASLDAGGQAAMRADLVDVATRFDRAGDGTAICPFGCIIAVATKR